MAKTDAKQPEGIVKHFVLAFVIALALYIGSFAWIQHRRTFRGPWEITFATDAQGQPSLLIAQPKMGILQEIAFPGQKIAPPGLERAQKFDDMVTNIPFGTMLFQDPLYLPGSITMKQFGHEIQLLPRVMIIDNKEVPWGAGQPLEIR